MKSWSQSLTQPANEFALTNLPLLQGTIPEGLRGSLYRNGPARLQRAGETVGHWFDGDGAILAVHFTNKGAEAVYRYVQTEGYQAETKANRFLFANYGMKASGSIFQRLRSQVKNAANTSVLALPDRLLALWEGGNPHQLDLHTLETWGKDDLSFLSPKAPFSAHPKIDADTGDIFNFGVIPGFPSNLHLYRSDYTGKIQQHQTFPLSGLPLIHDFVMAGSYLVFCVSPVRISLLPVMLGQKSYSEAMEWKPELGSEILIFHRHSLSLVSRTTTTAFYQWHFANGYENKDGEIVLAMVRYEDFQTNQYLKEVATGKTQTYAPGNFWQMRLDGKTGKVLESQQLSNKACEFPIVAGAKVGKPWRYSFMAIHREGINPAEELFGAMARFDHHTGNLDIAELEENCYTSEPIFVANREEKGWIINVVYNGKQNCSEVRIYDSSRLKDEPICRLALPDIIPPGFHGTWQNS